MKKCMVCGSENDNDSLYCSGCGNVLHNNSLMNNLSEIIKYADKSTRKYFESLAEYKKVYDEYKRYKNRMPAPLLFCVILVCCCFVIYEYVVVQYYSHKTELIDNYKDKIIAVGIIFVLIDLFISVIYGFSTRKKVREQYVVVENWWNELKKDTEAFNKISVFYPEEYRVPIITNLALNYVTQRRASSMKELLDMLDTQIHRWNLEEKYQKMIDNQQQIVSYQNKQLKKMRELDASLAISNFNSSLINWRLWIF